MKSTMRRPSHAELTRGRHAAPLVSILLVLPILFAACGGTPALPELTDPTEILQAAATNAASATAVHVDVRADGGLRMRTGPATTTVQLDGTTANLDLDIANGNARVTFAAPALLNARGEVLVVDGVAYAKTSLTGKDFVKLPMDGIPFLGGGAGIGAGPGASGGASNSPGASNAPGESPGSVSIVAAIAQFLATPGLEPTKGEDMACGTTTCYTVTIDLTADEIASLGLGGDGTGIGLPIPSDLPIPLPDLSNLAGVTFTTLVDKDARRLAEVSVEVRALEAATARLDLRFSKWDEPITIEAPPADQTGGPIGG